MEGCGLACGGRQCNACRAQGETGGGTGRRADYEALAVVCDLGLGQLIEIGDEIRPGARTVERGDAVYSADRQCAQQAAEEPAIKGQSLQQIWMAETKKDVLLAFDAFIETWGVR